MSRIRLQAACDALGLTARGVQAMAARGEIPGAGSIYRLQQHLGHSSVKTTEGYCAFITPDQAERAKGPAQNTAQAQRIYAGKSLLDKGENGND